MTWSLKKKLLLPTTALVIAVMSITTAVTYYLSSRAFNENAHEEFSSLVKSKAELIDVWIDDMKAMIKTSAGRPEYEMVLKNDTDANRNAANFELAEQVKDLKGISYIYIANTQGEVRAASIPESVGKIKVADRDYFQKALKGEVTVSSIYVARTTGKPAFAIAAPIKDGKTVIGAIWCVPNIAAFNEKFIDPVKVLETGYMYLFDSTGMIFAHKDKSLIMKLNLNEHEFGRNLLQLKQGELAYEFQGMKRMAHIEPCKNSGWTVGVVAPAGEFYAETNRMTWIIVGLSSIGLMAILSVLIMIVRSVAGPLNRVAEGLNAGADQVSSASAQVSASSQSLAEGSSEQAASIEETSSSLEEMSSMTKQNADNASAADKLMKESRQMVDRANGSMKELTHSMEDITKASDETFKIIKTIDEIAFQTNLLALNAAVEAARAGEAGAGFAVVANEVRNLAMRAAEAAKNTSILIEGTVKNVQKGSELLEQTNAAFAEVSTSAGKVAGLISEIAAASGEQTQGIDQIGKAVSEMEKVTQRNAANAEESASASEEMNAQASQMKQIAQELYAIVEGDASLSSPASAAPAAANTAQKNAPTLKSYAKKSGAKAKDIRPEAVIPLDDKDFKNF